MHTSIRPEQEKAGDARIGPRGVWTQAGGAGGSEGPLVANAGRIPANPVNTNVLVLEQGAKAGKARVVWFESPWMLFVYVWHRFHNTAEPPCHHPLNHTQVLALCEGGPPFEFDPVALALGQPETFGT